MKGTRNRGLEGTWDGVVMREGRCGSLRGGKVSGGERGGLRQLDIRRRGLAWVCDGKMASGGV